MPGPSPTAPQSDDAWGGDALSFRVREALLGTVALMMVGVVLVDGRPRVTFGSVAVLSLALIVLSACGVRPERHDF